MLSVASTQPSQVFSPTLVRYGRQLQRPVEIALPFLKLNSEVRRICNAFKDTARFSVSIYGLYDAVRQRDAASAGKHTVRLAIKAIGIVAAVFEYRAAKIAKDSLDLLKNLKDLACSIPNQDLEEITTLFWTVVLSSLSLGLTLMKSTELILAFELLNVAISLNSAEKEAKDEKRLPEMVAHLAMACVRVHRSSEPLIVLLERPALMRPLEG